MINRQGIRWILRDGRTAPFAAAAVLVVAAALKSHQVATDPAFGILYGSRRIEILLIAFEVSLAAWLILGLLQAWCRIVALLTFAGLACASSYFAIRGEPCGCFGAFHVAPWWVATLDAVLLVLLWLWSPHCEGITDRFAHKHGRASIPVTLVVGIIVVANVALMMDSALAFIAAHVSSDQDVVVVDFRESVGKPFSLLNSIDVGVRLRTGTWVVMLYQHDCPKCHLAIGKLLNGEKSHDVALVEVPPYDIDSSFIQGQLEYGRLNSEISWFVQTPTIVQLQDGVVIAVSHE
jgi:hypothetical protein